MGCFKTKEMRGLAWIAAFLSVTTSEVMKVFLVPISLPHHWYWHTSHRRITEVSCVQFHPTSQSDLVTAGDDGLLCVVDSERTSAGWISGCFFFCFFVVLLFGVEDVEVVTLQSPCKRSEGQMRKRFAHPCNQHGTWNNVPSENYFTSEPSILSLAGSIVWYANRFD